MNNDSNIDDKEKCKGCGKLFKRGRGLKIHHTKSGCLKTNVPQRKISKSEVEVAQEANHSSDTSHVGLRETTIVAEGKAIDSSPIEQNQTAEQKEKERKEEDIEIKVEEGVYNEVQDWIVKMEKTDTGEKKRKEKRIEEKKNKDIRTWLLADKEVKNSRTVVARFDKKDEQEDTETQGTRTVVRNLDKVKEGQNSKETLRQRDGEREKSEDIRHWCKVVQVKDSVISEDGIREQGEESEKDTRRVVKKESATVSNHINEGPEDEVLARHGLHLKRCDMKTLIGQNYLNDKIIDEYMRLVQQRNETHPELPKVKACTTFLYTQLKTFGLAEGCRRTKRWIREDLTKKDFILFPIHNKDHWSPGSGRDRGQDSTLPGLHQWVEVQLISSRDDKEVHGAAARKERRKSEIQGKDKKGLSTPREWGGLWCIRLPVCREDGKEGWNEFQASRHSAGKGENVGRVAPREIIPRRTDSQKERTREKERGEQAKAKKSGNPKEGQGRGHRQEGKNRLAKSKQS